MLSFLFLTMLSLGSLASAQNCLIQGRCVNSHLIQLTGAGSATDCLQDCKDFQGCQWYSFKQRSKTTCELFSDCNEISTDDCDQCQTGEVSCDLIQCDLPGFCTVSNTRLIIYQEQCHFFIDCDIVILSKTLDKNLFYFQGYLLDTLKVSSKQQCLENCKNMPDCHWISFGLTEALNECFLFETCDSIDGNDVEYISSQEECPTDENPFFSKISFLRILNLW